MRIRNQNWERLDNNYVLNKLHECYWSAYQRYGWEEGVPGIGISAEMVNKAIEEKCGIVIEVIKYGTYRINPKKLEKYHNQNFIFMAHDHKILYVYPLTEFEKYQNGQQPGGLLNPQKEVVVKKRQEQMSIPLSP